MKEIQVICKKTGIANITTNDVPVSNESKATKLVIDFSDLTDNPGMNKWVDLIMADGTSLRYDLGVGVDEIVEKELDYPESIPGPMTITPFMYDGVPPKIKFRTDKTIRIYRQEEAGTLEAIERDDYIFELNSKVTSLEERIEILEGQIL